jgi:kynurenine formamidase
LPLPAEFHELAKKVNNWGRWGPDDERGTLNLITDEVVARAVGCARTGRRFGLALALGPEGPMLGNVPGRPSNPKRTMLSLHLAMSKDPDAIRFSDDQVSMPLQAATHWDSLAHVSYMGKIYNGFAQGSVDENGAARCGIDKVGALVSRGVLLDVARALQVERLEPGYAITASDLDAALSLAGLSIEKGDIVLIRTGFIQLFFSGDRAKYGAGDMPGLGTECALWFHDREVAAVATDTLAFEVWPCERRDVLFPVHLLDLVEMGMLQGQNFNLEELSAACAEDGVYEFFLSATPEPFARGLGGPVAPVAIK